MRWTSLLSLAALGLAAPALAAPPAAPAAKPADAKPMSTPANFEAETREWHAKRISRLKAEDSWLSLVGLHWLKEGDSRFGSAPDNDVVFPAPAR